MCLFRASYPCNLQSFQHSNVPQTRSATVVSMRLKKISPPTNTTPTPAADASSSSPGGWPTPVSAQRNPSITPAIGLRPYSQRHRCGTSELGYATGEANIQNCTRNGIIVVKSRYKALSAEVHSPTASAVNTARRISAGNNSTVAPGRIPNDNVTTIITTKPMQKSTSGEHTAASGSTSRGKYTLVMTCWLLTTMLVQLVSAFEKYAQGTSAAK